jgi:chromosome segregation and condensation protein ScpB
MKTSPKHQIEALLFSSGKTLTVEKLSQFEEIKDKVGNLEVVDVSEKQQSLNEVQVVALPEDFEPQVRLYEKPSQEEGEHKNFLDDLDRRIEDLQQRNNKYAEDPLLQRDQEEESIESDDSTVSEQKTE